MRNFEQIQSQPEQLPEKDISLERLSQKLSKDHELEKIIRMQIDLAASRGKDMMSWVEDGDAGRFRDTITEHPEYLDDFDPENPKEEILEKVLEKMQSKSGNGAGREEDFKEETA